MIISRPIHLSPLITRNHPIDKFITNGSYHDLYVVQITVLGVYSTLFPIFSLFLFFYFLRLLMVNWMHSFYLLIDFMLYLFEPVRNRVMGISNNNMTLNVIILRLDLSFAHFAVSYLLYSYFKGVLKTHNLNFATSYKFNRAVLSGTTITKITNCIYMV